MSLKRWTKEKAEQLKELTENIEKQNQIINDETIKVQEFETQLTSIDTTINGLTENLSKYDSAISELEGKKTEKIVLI